MKYYQGDKNNVDKLGGVCQKDIVLRILFLEDTVVHGVNSRMDFKETG